MKIYCNFCNKRRKFKTLKYDTFLKKTWDLSIVYISVVMNMKLVFKKEESSEILKILVLINNIDKYHKIYNYIFIKQCHLIVWSVEKTQKVKIQKL